MSNDAELRDKMLFLWGKDPSAARRPAFDISPCLFGAGDALVRSIFEGMLGFLRIAPRPTLSLKPQPTGLIRQQEMVWVDGQYDFSSECVTV